MSNGKQDDAFFNFLLIAGGVIGAIVFVIYLLSVMLPYLVFYVLPLVLLSLLVGAILWISAQTERGGEVREEGYEKKYFAKFNHRRLAVTFPVLAALIFIVFELDSKRIEEVNAKGELQRVYLEWPKVHKAFNQMRKNAYGDSSFESLRAKARMEVIYDRSQVGGIFWLALIFGGPGFFFYLSRRDEEIEAACMNEEINRLTKAQKERLRVMIDDQEEIIKSRQKPLLAQVAKLEANVVVLANENQILKAKVEFSTTAPVIAAQEKKAKGGGVLDGDLL
jgi:hypothetical protein